MRADFQNRSQSRELVRASIADSILPAAYSLNVLVLDEWLHYPPNSGRGVRTWSLLQRLARRHRVSLLCYGDPEAETSIAARAAGIYLHLVPRLPAPGGARLYGGLFANLFSRYPYSVWKHYTRR